MTSDVHNLEISCAKGLKVGLIFLNIKMEILFYIVCIYYVTLGHILLSYIQLVTGFLLATSKETQISFP